VLSGGPNTGLEDPVAKERLAGCRPQKCYLDHIDAWSLNEVTVNWNSALAWLAAWAAEKAGSGTSNDTTAPSTPTGLSASGTTATGTRLTWTAATDNVGVTGYEVLRAPGASGGTFTAVATTTATSHTDSGLEPANTYRYQVRARDAAGNQSAPSDAVLVTTPSSGVSGGCSVDATSQSQWETGYVVQPIMVTNTGSSTIQGWTVTFTLPAGHRVTGFWNADVTVSGQNVTARGVASNRTLAPGATAQWGYQASRPNSGAVASGYSCTAS
jgi:endoglucanase